ncbi:MAG TPA: glycosyltransferase family 39 protein [Syntrophorhabdaceae bacterium]|jgi:4-amino-4-deoxy-L-arabinose transferase-like glycosyltransferase
MKTKILLLLILSGILFFNNLGATALWDPDEPRQAIMAREMMERHDYIHPYLNGKPYLEKPPFYPWMIIIASKISGSLNEFSSRVPAALSATGLVLATFWAGSVMLSPWGGFLAASILATNYQFLSNARESVMDMTFAFFIGLTIVLAYLAMTKGRRILFILAFLPAALATLTKGPAGLVIPAGVMFVLMLMRKEMKRFFLPLVFGSLLSLAAASIWFFLAGEAYIKEFIFRQNITRYTNAFDHIESFAYYFHKLFFNFMPWALFLPFALYHGVKKKYWMPFIWFAVTFLFFEISSSKRAIYLLSLYPACALLTAFYIRDKWKDLVSGAVTGSLLKVLAFLLTLAPLAAVAAFFIVPNETIGVFKNGPSIIYLYIGLLAAAGAMFLGSLIKKADKPALYSFFTYLAVAGLFYGALYMPVMDAAYKSPRLLTDKLKTRIQEADVYTYGFSSAGIIYYVGKPIQTFFSLKEIKDGKRDILLIIEDGQDQYIRRDLETRFAAVGKARYEREYFTFYVRKDGR